MTDSKKKGGPADEFDVDDLDFGTGGWPDAPTEGHAASGNDFDFDMPDPGRPHASAAAPATAPEDDFADLGGFGEVAPAPVAAPRPAERAAPVDEFGIDEFEEAQAAPRGRVSLGKGPATAATAATSYDDDERSFDGEGDEPGEDAHDEAPLPGERRGARAAADMAPLDDEGAEGEEAAPRKSFLDPSKLMMPVAGTLSAAFIAFMGWTYFLSPMLGTADAPVPTGPLQEITSNANPQAGRPAGPGLGSAPRAAGIDAPLAPMPASTGPGAGGPQQASAIPQRTFPSDPQPMQATRLPDAPGVPAATALAKPDPAMADRLRAQEARIEDLTRQVAALQQRPSAGGSGADVSLQVSQLAERIAAMESRPVPPAPRPEVQVPYKPQVIDGWSLQGVNRDVAWVQGPKGLIEVREGDDLGSAGKVMGIQKYKKDFIVVTTVGVIMRS